MKTIIIVGLISLVWLFFIWNFVDANRKLGFIPIRPADFNYGERPLDLRNDWSLFMVITIPYMFLFWFLEIKQKKGGNL